MKSLHVDGGDERRHSVAHEQHDMMNVFDGADKHQTCWKLTTARRPRVFPGKRPCMSKLASTSLPGTCTVILWSSFVFFKCEMSMYATRIAFSSGIDDGVAAAHSYAMPAPQREAPQVGPGDHLIRSSFHLQFIHSSVHLQL